ncbi:MAG: DUF1440 domain-containing protein [Armatimonadota bacterium]
MNSIVAGAVAGFLATAPMTAAMLALHRLVPPPEREPLPPEEITQELAARSGAGELPEPALNAATVAAHFAYGAAAGGVYGALSPEARRRPVATGIGFGLAVWTVSYLGWLPAGGILEPATRQPASENALMIASHVVWGAITGALTDRLAD